MRTRILAAVAAAAFGAAGASGCYAHHGHLEPDPVGMCLFGACLGYEVSEANHHAVYDEPPAPPPSYVLQYHDNHWHGPGCGCPTRWLGDHQVYWYDGHWEYFDGRYWIAFDTGAPGPSW